ncbi:TonB-dependent receptor family protein [Pseudoteredinibacter isoporae]|uniref:Fe(3+) dicitrate transport protein n=1 Tax=Pseudoteredinibacter isoporae TaxID=570281 RepID=A0A7X0JTK7_9GAMM|nr:TonB-dependent receptor [Pseudoteredinibacter isoporae]MBB6521483.1 Fe(3+) dicitrate transport protein [Pseudoteredinibacter isoporae]NHO87037.1 TonB-dependent receptor [Pseudoteredinibacter isoporae]NIB24510.1 TonB-dependent receptor [Pseudoteredinibacter isoporae]
MKKSVLGMAILLANQAVMAADSKAKLEEVTIIGNPEEAQLIPGSAHVIGEQELEKFEFTDINRIVRQVPGVYLQEEDGFGLRPNIGIRGAVGERSSKINLMEDGVLIAPAPYSAPSAYYFPTAGRMSSVEVLKGAETLRQGPATVGGAVNLISTRIPEQTSGSVNAEAGEDGAFRVHANYGYVEEQFAFLLETHQQGNDGFKNIDRSSRDTGFYIEDYLAKVRVNSDPSAEFYQQLDIKVQYSEELSDETYLGLTDKDFTAAPDRRYGLSKLDEMNTRHSGVQLRHHIEFNSDLSLTTTAYQNKFKRDWFKVKGVGGLIDDVNAGNSNAANAQAILDGTADADGIAVKHNNRKYTSEGIQFKVDWVVANHQIEMGARYHQDDVDRHQPEEIFNQRNGELVFDYVKQPSSSNNRVEDAEAIALHIMDVWSVTDELKLNLGLRYEDIETSQTRYGNNERTEIASTRSNQVDELLYSAGVTYELNDQVTLLAGVHSGFAPTSPSSRENIEPETSTNYEAGIRLTGEDAKASVIAFFSDYESTVTNCTVNRPCGDQTSGSESEGESEVKGVEVTVDSHLYRDEQVFVPISMSYTYTDAEITDPKDSGNQVGDLYEYLPKNTFSAQIGYELASGWNSYLSVSYVDEMCTDSSLCGRNDLDQRFAFTDQYWVTDFSTHYPLNKDTQLYLKVDNIFDERAIVSRNPDGARPNKPRTALIGVNWNF